MLTFESPVYEIEGVIVFRDHQGPGYYQYLTGSPHITRKPDGPAFMMITYRDAVEGTNVSSLTRDQLGGAFLMFEVDCGLSDAKLAAIKSELSAIVPDGTPEINLSPVLYTKGTASVMALDYQQPQALAPGTTPAAPGPPLVPPAQAAQVTPAGRFVRGVVGTSTPDLQNNLHSTFSLALTPDAAVLLEAAYDNDLTPIGVLLTAEFTGLRPALSVKAHADKKKIYEHLKLAFHAGYTSGSAAAESSKQPPPETVQAKKQITKPPGAPHGAGGPAGTGATKPAIGGTKPATGAVTAKPASLTTPAPTATGQAAGGQGAGGQGAGGQGAGGQGAGGQGAGGQGAGGQGAGGQGAGGQGAGGQGAGGQGAGGQGAGGQGAGGQGAGGQGAGGQGAGGQGAGGQGAGGQGAGGQGAGGQGAGGQGAGGQGAGGQGAGGQGAGGQGAGGQTSDGKTSVALAADIDVEIDKMVQDGTLTIEIVREADGQSVEAMQTQAMDLVKQLITSQFFSPAQSNIPAAAATAGAKQFTSFTAPAGGISKGTAGSNGQLEIGFQLQYMSDEELGSFDIDFSFAAQETRTHAPNGLFSALLSDVDKATHIKQISLNDAFFRQIDVTVGTTGEFARYDIQSAVVDLQHGGTVDAPVVAGSIPFTPDNQAGGHFVAFPDAGDYEVRHRITYDLGDSPDIAGQPGTKEIVTNWTVEATRNLVVHPSDDISIRSVFVEPGVIDWDVIDRVETTLTYNDPGDSFTTARTYIVGPTSAREEWRVRLTNPSITGYTVQHRWHLKDGQRVIEDKPTPTDADHYYVPDPFMERLPITVSALVDPAQVGRVDVQISYQDDGNDFSVTKIVEVQGPEFAPVTVEIPLMDSDVRSFSYVATLVKLNGSPQKLNSVTTDSPSVFISDGHFLDVTVTLLGSLAAAGLDGVQVDLRTDPADGAQAQPQSVLFQQGSPPGATVRLTMRPDRGSQYQYQTTAFLTNGAPVVRPWASANTTSLVLQPARLASTG